MASANATKVEKSQTGIRWARDDLWLNPKGCKQWLIEAAKSLSINIWDVFNDWLDRA